MLFESLLLGAVVAAAHSLAAARAFRPPAAATRRPSRRADEIASAPKSSAKDRRVSFILGETATSTDEFRINTYTPNRQSSPRVATDAGGGFVVVWQSETQDGSSTGVFGQRYDSGGAPQGVEFAINTFTTGPQSRPSVARAWGGAFVVAWQSLQDGSGYGVFGRRYDDAGAPLGDEFRVNAATTAAQALPSVASDSSGNFVVVWVSQNVLDSGVFGRRYTSMGSPLGAEFRVSTYATSNATLPSVASDAAGRFVVVWESFYPYGASAVHGRRYDEAGAPLGGEFRVNTLVTSSCGSPSVASSPSGDFVVVWQGNQDGSGYGVFGRRFDASGAPRGAEFGVNTFNLNDQSVPSVAVDDDGSFAVVWQSEFQDGALTGVFGRRYDGAGTPLGAEFRVNGYTTNDQVASAIAGAPGGGFVAVWQSDGQDGSTHGVFGRRICPPLVSVTVDVTGTTTVCPSSTGGTATVTDVDGGARSHQWGYRTSAGPRVPMDGQTGPAFVIDGASFPGPGFYYLSCLTTPECGAPAFSNEVVVIVSADRTPPSIAAPPPVTTTQTLCN